MLAQLRLHQLPLHDTNSLLYEALQVVMGEGNVAPEAMQI